MLATVMLGAYSAGAIHKAELGRDRRQCDLQGRKGKSGTSKGADGVMQSGNQVILLSLAKTQLIQMLNSAASLRDGASRG